MKPVDPVNLHVCTLAKSIRNRPKYIETTNYVKRKERITEMQQQCLEIIKNCRTLKRR